MCLYFQKMLESLVKVKVLKCMPSIFSPIKLLVLRFPCASNVLPMPPTYQNLDCILKIRPIFVHQNFCKMKYSFPPHKKTFTSSIRYLFHSISIILPNTIINTSLKVALMISKFWFTPCLLHCTALVGTRFIIFFTL